jgi:hypothetical protein
LQQLIYFVAIIFHQLSGEDTDFPTRLEIKQMINPQLVAAAVFSDATATRDGSKIVVD